MPPAPCPDAAQLTSFQLGELPDGELEAIADHLEGCPGCTAAVRELDRLADPIISSLRRLSGDVGRAAPAAAPTRVGDYEILGELGHGGMGVVYKARHAQLRRVVALKMLLGGEFARDDYRARFRAEAEAVARLQHPNIVQLFDVGEWHPEGGGRPVPYFTLEFVEGGTLAALLAGRPQRPEQAARWLEALARAAHYAHGQGVVHRDLKPSNVLVTADGAVKLCDFGVARRLTDSDLRTVSGVLVGTPEYMAPEQARGLRAGPAADVFALGAVLYTVLSGRPPFQGASAVETLEQVRAQEPVPLRRLLPGLPRDLETVCQKCLEKDPRKRYAGAGELADDLGRFLAGRPILARPTGPLERTARWARRRPTVAGLWTAVVLLTVGAFLLVGWQWREAVDQRRRADERTGAEARARERAERLAAGLALDRGLAVCGEGDVGTGLLWLLHALERAVEVGDADLERVARANLALWRPWLVRERACFSHSSWVWATFTPDGRTVLTGCHIDRVAPAQLWDGETGRPLGSPLPHRLGVRAVALSPDGKLALTGSGDPAGPDRGEARLWDVPSGRPCGEPLALSGGPLQVAFAPPDGRTFLTVCAAEARLWEVPSAKPEGSAATARPLGTPLRHPGPLRAAVYSADGRFVLTAGNDGTARLWDARTGTAVRAFVGHAGPVLAVAFSPDGSRALTGSADGSARLWRTETGAAVGERLVHFGPVLAVAFSPDGRTVATGGVVWEGAGAARPAPPLPARGEARLWDADRGAPRGAPLSHPEPVYSLALSPGGRVLLTGCQDRKARFFQTDTGTLIGTPREHGGTVATAAFSSDGRLALTAALGGERPEARVWEVPREDVCRTLSTPKPVDHLAFGPTGALASASRFAGETRLWDLGPGPPSAPRVLAHPDGHGICGLAFYADGRLLTAGYAGVCRLWEVPSAKPEGSAGTGTGRQLVPEPLSIRSSAPHPDARTLFLGDTGGSVRRHRLDTGAPVGPALEHGDSVWGLAVSPDGRTVLTGSHDRSARLWDAETGRLLHRWEHEGQVRVVAFHPSGRSLLTVPLRRPPRLWDGGTFAAVDTPLVQRIGPVETAAFSPDGRALLTGSAEGHARLWDLATGKPLGPPLPHPDRVLAVAMRRDGRLVATGCHDHAVRLWPLPPPVEGPVERVRLWVEALTGREIADGGVRELSPEALRDRRERLAQTAPGD